MTLKNVINVVPCGQFVVIKDYETEELYYKDDAQFLKQNKSLYFFDFEVKMISSQNDVEFDDALIIELENNNNYCEG